MAASSVLSPCTVASPRGPDRPGGMTAAGSLQIMSPGHLAAACGLVSRDLLRGGGTCCCRRPGRRASGDLPAWLKDASQVPALGFRA